MILINVLVIVMLATAILAVMIAGDDTDVELNIRMANATQARAVAAGGEMSAIVALRRDLAPNTRGGAQGPANDSDSAADEWARIGDDRAAIDGGRFTFAVTDAQALFNLNNLMRCDTLTSGTFANIVAALNLPPDTAARAIELVRANGGLTSITDLAQAGISAAAIQQLATLTTVLPEPTSVNLNTAPEALVAIMLNNAGKARVLMAAREAGGMNRDDLIAANLFPPPGTGVTSNYFWARSLVEIGGDGQQLTSLLYRRIRNGGPQVLVVKRWRGAAPIQVPPASQGS